ncbi:MAG: DNA-3-methyladenine glycosylase [Myxococcales bacterium]|jgi:DNA-3-methyladenine glycosylase
MPTRPLPAPLPRSFYDRPTDLVARELIGCLVVHRDGETERVGRVVETEAYLGVRDKAAHSYRGRTPRTEAMFGPPGHAYVYFIYGAHYCLNAVTRPEGEAEAVLIRAIEPIANCLSKGDGPGLVSKALNIDKSLNQIDLTGDRLFFAPGDRPPAAIVRGPRVGVDYAGAWARRLLRFYEKDSPFVSRAGGARKRPSPKRRRVV